MKKLFNRKSQKQLRQVEVDEAYVRRLFQECKIGQGNAALLYQALTLSKPEDLVEHDVIQEFYHKCRSSQELLVSKISWAFFGAAKSREASNKVKTQKQASSTDMRNQTPTEATTEAEDLLAALLAANAELIEVLKQYDDLAAAIGQQADNCQSGVGTRMDQMIDVTSVDSSLSGSSPSLPSSPSLRSSPSLPPSPSLLPPPYIDDLDTRILPITRHDIDVPNQGPPVSPILFPVLLRAPLCSSSRLNLHIAPPLETSCNDNDECDEPRNAPLQSLKVLGKQKAHSERSDAPSEGDSCNKGVHLDDQNQIYEGYVKPDNSMKQFIAQSTQENTLIGVDNEKINQVTNARFIAGNSRESALLYEEIFEQTAEQNKIIQRLLAQAEEGQKLRNLYERQIDQVMEAYLTATRCEICFEIMEKQFTIRECGHTFCGLCLRKTFMDELKPRLLAITSLARYGRPKFDCQAIPSSKAHLRKTVDGIKKDTSRSGGNPEAVFVYTCPWCRGLITKPPIIQFSHAKLLESVHDALQSRLIHSSEYDVREQEDIGVDYFEGLFLD